MEVSKQRAGIRMSDIALDVLAKIQSHGVHVGFAVGHRYDIVGGVRFP